MKAIFIFSFLLISSLSIAQNLTGTWEGEYKTSLNSGSYLMHIELVQEGNKIKGYFYTAHPDYPDKHAPPYRIEGITGNKPFLKYRNYYIENDSIGFPGEDVAYGLEAGYFKDGKTEVLFGSWREKAFLPASAFQGSWKVIKTDTSLSEKGKNLLFPVQVRQVKKEQEPGLLTIVSPSVNYIRRKDSIVRIIEVNSDSVEITLYDNGSIDHDTVSIFIDDQLMLEKHELTVNRYSFKIPISLATEKKISLFAENLGDIPPNTALMIIRYDNKEEYVYLSADFQKNGSIIIRRK